MRREGCGSKPVIDPPCLAGPGAAGGNNCFAQRIHLVSQPETCPWTSLTQTPTPPQPGPDPGLIPGVCVRGERGCLWTLPCFPHLQTGLTRLHREGLGCSAVPPVSTHACLPPPSDCSSRGKGIVAPPADGVSPAGERFPGQRPGRPQPIRTAGYVSEEVPHTPLSASALHITVQSPRRKPARGARAVEQNR